MSGRDDILSRAKKERRFFEQILSVLPGFKGYKEKELRRESDRLLRDYLYRRLGEGEDHLKKFFQRLSDRRVYGVLEEVDRLVMAFDRVKARIDHASYGYSGFFDVLKVDERDLEEMLSFDEELIKTVEEIFEEVKALREVDVEKVGEIRRHLEAIRSSLEELEETFNRRKEKISGVK